jgi:hypothetical protein
LPGKSGEVWGKKMGRGTAIFGIAAAMLLSVTGSATALDRHVRIINNSAYDIREFYASNVGTNDWEEDILGRDILPSGYSVNINIDDRSGYCRYDFRAIFEDGESVVTEGVNVCEVGEFTYHD